MNFADIPLAVNETLPPGVVMIRSDREQAFQLIGDALELTERSAIAPALAEDCRSVAESAPFLIRFREGTPPIVCECCGTMVTAVPEADTRTERPYRWQRAIWESGAGRKHTLRRCEALRG